MFNLPHKHRLQLAEFVQSQQIKSILQMPEPQLQKFLEKQVSDLQKKQLPSTAALAYQSIAPLLLENKAILTFLEIPENFQLNQALPDVSTPDEALLLAQKEYQLKPLEVSRLKPLLDKLRRDKA